MEKSRAIELLEHLAWDRDNEGNCYGEALRMAIDALRQPEKIMHWEQKVIHSEFKREQLEETVIYICDRCGQRSEKETNFCPNCGAKADWFCEKDGGRKMTNAEAIETLRANYPDACFEQLREAVDVAIKALKAQDIAGDTISRQWLLDCINDGWIKFDTDKDTNRFIHLVRDIAPPAQPEPQEGHWNPHETPDGGEQYECSRCGVLWEFNDGTPEDNEAFYCPKCGARMKGERQK